MNQECTGAGIVVYYDNRGIKQSYIEGLDRDILYVFLNCINGEYDFPKGTIDFGEDSFYCAQRETKEEINIGKNDYFMIDKVGKDFVSDKKNARGKNHVLRMYIAELKKDGIAKLKIKENPVTEEKEHEGRPLLLKKDPASDNLLYYLKEVISWADNIVQEYLQED